MAKNPPTVPKKISFEKIKTGDATQEMYFLYDGIGSVVNLVDERGMLVQVYAYNIFGKSTNVKHDPTNKKQFTGKEVDEDSGLQYFLARYYDPEIGRFISVDPNPVLNLYVYCNNDPINRVDPDGRKDLSPEEVLNYIAKNNRSQFSTDYIFSLCITENSKFTTDSVGKDNDTGLMQMTPNTLKELNKKHKTDYTMEDMKNPEKNIQASTTLLQDIRTDLINKGKFTLERVGKFYNGTFDYGRAVKAGYLAIKNGKQNQSPTEKYKAGYDAIQNQILKNQIENLNSNWDRG